MTQNGSGRRPRLRLDKSFLTVNSAPIFLALRSHDRFIRKFQNETGGEIFDEVEIIRIPLGQFRARNATSRKWRAVGLTDNPFSGSPVFLAGDSAVGSPYFQSITLGMECAMFVAGLLGERDKLLSETFNRYENYVYEERLDRARLA